MGKVKDISGMRFGNWTVITFSHINPNGSGMFLCRCDCGTIRFVNGSSLRRGSSKSCGCIKPNKTSGHTRKDERLYGVWRGMLDRCRNVNSPAYYRYGGRGIKVCDEWLDYIAFREWAFAAGYDEFAKKYECTIDRIDNDGDYCPDNCVWHNQKEQCNNMSTNHLITYNGQTYTIKKWSEITGINKSTINKRINQYGWPVEKALTEKPNHVVKNRNVKYDHGGESHTLSEWSKMAGIPLDTLWRRVHIYHMDIDKALSKPVNKAN